MTVMCSDERAVGVSMRKRVIQDKAAGAVRDRVKPVVNPRRDIRDDGTSLRQPDPVRSAHRP